jgi:hypothetical protein
MARTSSPASFWLVPMWRCAAPAKPATIRFVRLAAFALVLAALCVLTGCAESGRMPLRDWTFIGPDGTRASVILPAHLDAKLPGSASHYALATDIALPDSLRDRPLTFVFPRLATHVVLKIDGALAESIEPPEPVTYRTKGPHAWRIPAEATKNGRLALELDADSTWTQSSWIDTVPRLTPALDGGAAFVAQRLFNEFTAVVALAVVVFVGFLYLVVFLTDRTRSNYGWFALTGLGGAGYPLFQTALLAPYAGPFDALLAGIGVSSAVITEMYFATVHFGLPRPARGWTLGYVGSVLGTIACVGFFRTQSGGAMTAVFVIPALAAEAALFTRLLRQRPRPPDLFLVLGGWPLMLLAATPDLAAWVGTGELLGGTRPACLGIALIGLLQTAAMSRAHTKSLRAADDLNAELQRQIEARSRELSVALARLGQKGDARPLEAGEIVEGRYEVMRNLGAGAGGAVYLVERLADRAPFAMKVVHGGDDSQRLARLAREAQLVAQVKDEHVISVVDVDIAASGFVYIVMEYVPGATLYDHKRDYGNVEWALPLLAQVADGLTAIHAHGIVHRDLKPSNVLVLSRPGDATPTIKISDFGIATGDRSTRVTARPPALQKGAPQKGGPTPLPDAASPLTHTGMVMGTPRYMAPEAIDGARDATPAIDMFAFGVLAYELLSGRAPFRESPAFAQLEGVSVAPPVPLAGVCPDIPPEIALIIDQCLSFVPEARPTAREAFVILSGAEPSSTLIQAAPAR